MGGSRKCPACGSASVEFEASHGAAVCFECGAVLEENAIVSEVTFQEHAGGRSAVVGQFVPDSGFKSVRRVGGMSPYTRESREVTLQNGRQSIQDLANRLNLNNHHIEAAYRLFVLAVQHNFIQGRKTQNVVAACLYIVCRREKTPHLLIDFADRLQTNVYILGSCFLKFARLLNMSLPIIDPSLYMHRFASKLEFDEQSHKVAETSLRLIQQMRRDWLQTGRRPSGLCGAALYIAAKLHGFRRTIKEIVQIVRVQDMTVRKRLVEFEMTPAGSITASEFQDGIQIDSECNPPAYQRAEQDRERLREDGHVEAAESLLQHEEIALLDVESSIANLQEESARSAAALNAEKNRDQEKQADEQPQATAGGRDREADGGEGSSRGHQLDETDTLSDLDDDELDSYLIDKDSERKQKELIWTAMNKEYLERLDERIARGEVNEQGNLVKRPVKRGRQMEEVIAPGNTVVQSVDKVIDYRMNRNVKAKIDYGDLDRLFASPTLPRRAAPVAGGPRHGAPSAPSRSIAAAPTTASSVTLSGASAPALSTAPARGGGIRIGGSLLASRSSARRTETHEGNSNDRAAMPPPPVRQASLK